MNRREFDQWLRQYTVLFPETAEWIGRVKDDARGPMLDAWAKLLEPVEMRDVMAVTWRMFEDDPNYPPLGVMFGDREKTPSHVLRLSKRQAFEREQRQQRSRISEAERVRQRELFHQPKPKWTCSGVYRNYQRYFAEAIAEGKERDEANRYAQQRTAAEMEEAL